jgi:hypothetical protein
MSCLPWSGWQMCTDVMLKTIHERRHLVKQLNSLKESNALVAHILTRISHENCLVVFCGHEGNSTFKVTNHWPKVNKMRKNKTFQAMNYTDDTMTTLILQKCNFLQVTPAKILHSLQCTDIKTHSCAAAKNRQELSGMEEKSHSLISSETRRKRIESIKLDILSQITRATCKQLKHSTKMN